ncbi:MAG: alpha-hydroxy-acid oxidizing protein [Propionibacteriales bacterium]|nr:alpha-hydroxy-acid oxidizing protein [Propionibacteriales bacterium]
MDEPWQVALEASAREKLPPAVYRYFADGAGQGITTAEAHEAWSRTRFAPHVLRDVREIELSTTLLGMTYRAPVGLAPTSLQRLAHPDGELAMARAAAATRTLLCVSSNAGTRFEEIGDTGASWWLQLYVPDDRTLVEPLLEDAVRAGASAVVVTVDAAGTRVRADAVEPLDEVSARYRVNHADPAAPGAAGHAFDLGVHDLDRVARLTGLPVVVKGVLRPDDARRCADAGVAAVWVSNHGGRQLDRSVATADVFGSVAQEVGDAVELYVDGGIRGGLDLVAAVARGADTAFVGRLALFALAVGGEAGVVELLDRLRDELQDSLRRAGCVSPADARGLVPADAPPAG